MTTTTKAASREKAKAQPTGADRLAQFGSIMMWIVMLLLLFVMIFPLFWVLRTALTSPGGIFTDTASLMPVDPTLTNFGRVLGLIDPTTLVGEQAANISPGTINFFLYLRNSIIVTGLITFGQVFFCSMAGYAFARLHFPGRQIIFYAFLAGLMIPGIVLFLPNYVLIRQLGLIGTFAGIIAPAFFFSPFAVFFMRQFFLSLNKELEEAALLDGATPFGVFWRIALPLMSGPILTLGLLTFIAAWNDYLWPLLVGRDESVRVLTVALGIYRQQTPQGAPDWTGLMSATLVSIIPTLLLFVFFGRKIVNSVQFAGFK
jgi:multiple sugar transport system permease protein